MIAVDQTIFVNDPGGRLGNCVAACVASHLELPLSAVPHFMEEGIAAGDPVDGKGASVWWWLLVGYMGANGLHPVELASLEDAEPGEVVWVAGTSPRGVLHQVLYADGALLHDPHPSRAGVLDIVEVLAWRPRGVYNHTPTTLEAPQAIREPVKTSVVVPA